MNGTVRIRIAVSIPTFRGFYGVIPGIESSPADQG